MLFRNIYKIMSEIEFLFRKKDIAVFPAPIQKVSKSRGKDVSDIYCMFTYIACIT